ncbi:MAG: D-2-hydroxyacid dehydrogenase family protein [Pseudolabrys sp.]
MRMVKAAILDDYQNVAMGFADWSPIAKDVDITVFDRPFASQDEAVKALQGFPIIVGMRERTPFPRAVIEALPDLKLLITTGGRNNSFDLKAAKERGVTVCGTGSFGSPTTGVAFGLMLELTRHIGLENARMKAGAPLQTTIGPDLGGMTPIAWSPNLTPERATEGGADYATKEELFAKADIITIHIVLSEATRGLITAADIGRMKKSAFIINTSRGPIIDEQALIAALQAKQIAGAGLDVFDREPLPLDHPYRTMDNVVITPHIGYVSTQNYGAYFPDIVEDIRGWLDGKPVRVLEAK